MEIGFVGLGKMGGNMVRRLLREGHVVVVTDRDPAAADAAAAAGATRSAGLPDLVSRLARPRAVWAMVPAGDPTESVVAALGELLSPGDVVLDGGNSSYHDSQRRSADLFRKGVHFVDVGTSGGVWGLQYGYCLMVGGEEEPVSRLAPVFRTLAPPDGWLHCGPSGAGHYVKMVHNGVEYALMQAYAEGFELMQASGLGLDNARIARLWMQGSVVRSWLLELAAHALETNPGFTGIAPWVADSGEGRWTVVESVDRAVPTPAITAALQARFRSRQDPSYAAQFLNALRNEFGGHAVKKA
ncbi:decarboxylating 6-phosphogluconate dehydrogenase [Acidobacteria bacterium ACD]|nr:MAG: decarboxylating 6-phosphogluconate dehydrogenase [Acidobacteriota bacterium]MDL1952490.1 decarboxylating 6-phosphogluconate dehydrogenase [Acidobacteria bacterium ACD]